MAPRTKNGPAVRLGGEPAEPFFSNFDVPR